MTEENKSTVVEKKFNGTVTLVISGTSDRDTVKRIARRYFKDEYGHSPSRIVAEKRKYMLSEHEWDVMVADHSSGSLKGAETYEL
jgi:hypothetical protein